MRCCRSYANSIPGDHDEALLAQSHPAFAGEDVIQLFGAQVLVQGGALAGIDDGFSQALVAGCVQSGVHQFADGRAILGSIRGDLGVASERALGHAFAPSLEAFFFWLETGLFLMPFVLVGTAEARRNPARLFLAGCAIMLAGVFMRVNGFLIGYDTGPGWNYFPSIAEMLVTIGMFAVEVLGYIIITRRFPVLPREEAQAAH